MAITTTAVQNFGKEFSFNVCPATSGVKKCHIGSLLKMFCRKCTNNNMDITLVCLFAWGLTALSAQIGYIAP